MFRPGVAPILRRSAPKVHPRAHLSVRFNSSSSSNSKQQLEAAQKKAQEVLASTQATAGRVFESVKNASGPFAERVWKASGPFAESVKNASGPFAERVGKLLGSYQKPFVYNLTVGREVLKQIYHAENLRPPTSFNTIREAYETIWENATSKKFWRAAIESGDVAKLGIYAVEAYGIFKIGEIIGRRSLVGYDLH